MLQVPLVASSVTSEHVKYDSSFAALRIKKKGGSDL